MTYHLIIVYLFIKSIKLASVVFFRNTKKWLDLQPLTMTLTLIVGTNVLCMVYLSRCLIFLWYLMKFALAPFLVIAERYFELWPQIVTFTLSLGT